MITSTSGGGHNLGKVNVKPVGKGENFPRTQMGLNFLEINRFLHLIGKQDHEQFRLRRRFRHG